MEHLSSLVNVLRGRFKSLPSMLYWEGNNEDNPQKDLEKITTNFHIYILNQKLQ